MWTNDDDGDDGDDDDVDDDATVMWISAEQQKSVSEKWNHFAYEMRFMFYACNAMHDLREIVTYSIAVRDKTCGIAKAKAIAS